MQFIFIHLLLWQLFQYFEHSKQNYTDHKVCPGHVMCHVYLYQTCTNLRTFACLPLLLSIQRLPCPEHFQARRIKFEHLLLFPYIVQHRQAWLSNGWHCCWYANELLYFWGTGLNLCLCLAVLEGSPGKIGDFLTLHGLFECVKRSVILPGDGNAILELSHGISKAINTDWIIAGPILTKNTGPFTNDVATLNNQW